MSGAPAGAHCASSAASENRSIPRRGCGTTIMSASNAARRRYLVADRNRRDSDNPIPGATPLKPGSATRPFFGVKPVIVDNNGKVVDGPGEGNLCIANAWPGIMRTVFGDHRRFVQTYFSDFTGLYFTGDGARRDEDGFYWLTGRVDDVINVAGHRLGTAELDSALVAHPGVAVAAA